MLPSSGTWPTDFFHLPDRQFQWPTPVTRSTSSPHRSRESLGRRTWPAGRRTAPGRRHHFAYWSESSEPRLNGLPLCHYWRISIDRWWMEWMDGWMDGWKTQSSLLFIAAPANLFFFTSIFFLFVFRQQRPVDNDRKIRRFLTQWQA